MGFNFSPGNDLISNLKKDVVRHRRNANVMMHKRRAICKCAAMISQGLNPRWLASAVLVPVPPSNTQHDEAYDDRMLRVAQFVQILDEPPRAAEVRELVRQTSSVRKSHECQDGQRASIDELVDTYMLDESVACPSPARIAIIDDMLTTGRHFRAMDRVLRARFPNAQIVGVFITRRVVPEGANFEGLFGHLL
jgi:predicted amidophosphoribosyltransferase